MQSCRQASNGNGLALSLSPTGTRWSSANSNHAQDRDAVLSERAGLSFPNTMGARIGRASTPSDRCAPRTKGYAGCLASRGGLPAEAAGGPRPGERKTVAEKVATQASSRSKPAAAINPISRRGYCCDHAAPAVFKGREVARPYRHRCRCDMSRRREDNTGGGGKIPPQPPCAYEWGIATECRRAPIGGPRVWRKQPQKGRRLSLACPSLMILERKHSNLLILLASPTGFEPVLPP